MACTNQKCPGNSPITGSLTHALCRNARDIIKSIQTKSHHKTTDPCHVNLPMVCDQHEMVSV